MPCGDRSQSSLRAPGRRGSGALAAALPPPAVTAPGRAASGTPIAVGKRAARLLVTRGAVPTAPLRVRLVKGTGSGQRASGHRGRVVSRTGVKRTLRPTDGLLLRLRLPRRGARGRRGSSQCRPRSVGVPGSRREPAQRWLPPASLVTPCVPAAPCPRACHAHGQSSRPSDTVSGPRPP